MDVVEAQSLPLPSGAADKFYALLVQNSIQELVDAAIENENDTPAIQASERLLQNMCERSGIPFPVERIKAKYDTPREHMLSRAALVLEEARYSLCQDLFDMRIKHMAPALKIEMAVTKDDEFPKYERKANAQHFDFPVSFQRREYEKGWFTAKELDVLIPGLIIQCVSDDDGQELLGVVSLRNHKTTMASRGIMEIQFFIPSLNLPLGSVWTFYPVGSTHINIARQFEALLDLEQLVPFFEVVRGAEVPGDRGLSVPMESIEAESKTRVTEEQLQMPTLNESQQKGASNFLGSPDGTVSIVQGVGTAFVCFSFRSKLLMTLAASRNGKDNFLCRRNLSVFAEAAAERSTT